jgi:hypothetical protein
MSAYKSLIGLTTVRGDLTIQSTGISQLRIFDTSSARILNIGGNLNINGTSTVVITDSGTGNTINVGGSVLINSTSEVVFARLGSVKMFVNGNFTQTRGTVVFVRAGGARAEVELLGSVVSIGNISALNGGIGTFRFSGATQSFTKQNTITGRIDFILGTGTTLDLGTSFISGLGYLTVPSGSTIRLGAVPGQGTNNLGALQSNTTQGNIRLNPGRRTFAANSTIVYDGASAQQVGNGHPVSPGVNMVASTSGTLSILNNITVHNMNLAQGVLSLGTSNITVNGNWIVNGGSFFAGTGTVFFNGPGTIAGTGTKAFRNLTINPSGAVVFPSDVLRISGNLIVSPGGSIDANTGLVIFAGNVVQTVSPNGSQFNNITITKTADSVALTSAMNLRGVLNILSATTFNSAGFLTLLSTSPVNDASIGPLPAGAAVTGDVNIQRYMAAEGKVNRYISGPVAHAPVSQLQDDFPVTGVFTGTSYPCTGCTSNGFSLKFLDPNRVNMPQAQRFVGYPAVSNDEELHTGRGYAAYMWQGGVINLDYTGTIRSGTIDFPISYAQSTPANPSIDGYNLVGNPYPSSIKWDGGAGWTRTNISPTVYVPIGNTSLFHNYADGTGGLTDGIIAMGQGFYVVATGAGAAMSINESAKTTIVGEGYQRVRDNSYKHKSEQFIVSLEGVDFKTSAYLKLNQEASDNFDVLYDAYKLPIDQYSVAFKDAEGREMVMHTVSTFDASTEIPVTVDVLEKGKYTFSFGDRGSFPAFYLFDNVTGEYTEAASSNTYEFEVSEAGLVEDRFVLTQNPSLEEPAESVIQVFPNPFNDKLTIKTNSEDPASVELLDVRGRQVITQDFTRETTLEIGFINPGVYIARIKTSKGFVTKKLIKE